MGEKAIACKYSCPGWATRAAEQLRQTYKGCVQAKFSNGVWQARLAWSEWDRGRFLCPKTGSTPA